MKKAYSFVPILAGVLFGFSANGQFIEKHNFSFNNATYDVFSIKIDSSLGSRFSFAENKNHLTENLFFDSLARRFNAPFFSFTASIVDSLCNPLGLYINEKQKLSPLNLGSGNGNFYLKPNGVICLDSTTNAIIQEAALYNENIDYTSAIQSGPMLIISGSIHPVFDKNSKNKNMRCGVGIFDENNISFLVFIKSLVPVTFYQFAQVFQEKFKCRNALTLESGSNSSMHMPSQKNLNKQTKNVCRYIVITL